MTARARNLTSAIVLMGASAYWFLAAADYRPMSRAFPQVLATILFGLALLLAILTLLGHGPVIRLAAGDASQRHMRSGTLMAALVLWTVLIPIGGLLIASLVGVAVMGIITFRAHVGTVRAILIALAGVVVFYLLFNIVLRVPFPMGLLG